MYEQSFKFGKAIIVCGSRPCVGTSTAAAMMAATFANGGDKTLLLSTDCKHPMDAISLLSDTVVENYMDEMVALENSSGLNAENFSDYVSHAADNLAYTRLSTKLGTITRDVTRTLSHIIDVACHIYHYVLLDLDYPSAIYLHKLSEQVNLVTYLFGQDFRSLAAAKALQAQERGQDSDAVMLPVLMNYLSDLPMDDSTFAKAVCADSALIIEHDPEMFKAAQKRELADFVFRSGNKTGLKGFFKKKSASDEPESTVFASVSAICGLIKAVLNEGGDTE